GAAEVLRQPVDVERVDRELPVLSIPGSLVGPGRPGHEGVVAGAVRVADVALLDLADREGSREEARLRDVESREAYGRRESEGVAAVAGLGNGDARRAGAGRRAQAAIRAGSIVLAGREPPRDGVRG